MSEDQKQFIRRQLLAQTKEFDIPPELVDDLMHLMEQYPSLEGRGRLGDLVAELEKLFESQQRAGNL